MIIQGPEIYYAASCLILVVTSLFCALVRYFHMCRPFDEKEAYFYPARKLITIIYACFALPVVWLFRMDSPDAYFFMRVFLVLLLPGAGVLSFRQFFFSQTKHRRLIFVLSGIIPLAVILTCWIYGWIGGDTLHRHRDTLFPLIGGYSLLLTVMLLQTTCWLLRQIRLHMQEEYSNSDDFPVRFAGLVAFIPVLYQGTAWWLFITGDHDYNMWFQLAISVMHVVLLIRILHPQRKEYREVMEEAEELIAEKIETVLSDRGSGSSLLSVDAMNELEAKIRAALTEDRLYLNPNLKIGELADAVKSNRKYVSIVMKERFGSFYKELNRLRIEAAVRYREEHPSASREEIAAHCGFSNVRTYSRNLKSGMQDKNTEGQFKEIP